VIDGFGNERIHSERKIFEFPYGSTPGFPLPTTSVLRLLLTSPTEFRTAVRENWKAVSELKHSLRHNAAEVIYKDRLGSALLELL
jgi:hypothetical protein